MGKGQSILEYALLLCVVLAALLIMQVYIKRTYQGRIKADAESVGGQYSPDHTISLSETNTTSTSTTYTGGDFVTDNGSKVSIPDGMTVTKTTSRTTATKREGVDSFATE